MKPFKAQCNEVQRSAYTHWQGKKVEAKLCEEQIWFEPSLKKDIAVGHCKNQAHNPVYRVCLG